MCVCVYVGTCVRVCQFCFVKLSIKNSTCVYIFLKTVSFWFLPVGADRHTPFTCLHTHTAVAIQTCTPYKKTKTKY